MEAVAKTAFTALLNGQGPGWIVAVLALVALTFVYRELQKWQTARHGDVERLAVIIERAGMSSQAMTLALEAVKRGQEDVTRLIVEAGRSHTEIASLIDLSEERARDTKTSILERLDTVSKQVSDLSREIRPSENRRAR